MREVTETHPRLGLSWLLDPAEDTVTNPWDLTILHTEVCTEPADPDSGVVNSVGHGATRPGDRGSGPSQLWSVKHSGRFLEEPVPCSIDVSHCHCHAGHTEMHERELL